MTREPLVEAIEAYAQNIVDTVREPLLILDATLRVRSANRAFYQAFHVSSEETENRPIYELGNCQWDIPDLRTLLEDIVPKSSVFDDFELEHAFPVIGRRVMLLNARKLQAGQRGELLVLAMEDVTQRRRSEEEVAKAKEAAVAANRAKNSSRRSRRSKPRHPTSLGGFEPWPSGPSTRNSSTFSARPSPGRVPGPSPSNRLPAPKRSGMRGRWPVGPLAARPSMTRSPGGCRIAHRTGWRSFSWIQDRPGVTPEGRSPLARGPREGPRPGPPASWWWTTSRPTSSAWPACSRLADIRSGRSPAASWPWGVVTLLEEVTRWHDGGGPQDDISVLAIELAATT